MRRITMLAAGLLLAAFGASSAAAQDVAKVDVFGGYTYMYGNVVTTGRGISLNGGIGSAAYNFNNWLGLAADFGVYHQGNVAASGASLTVETYLAGPRLNWRKGEKFVPFAQVLVGGGHAGGGVFTTGGHALGTQNGFAMTAGGGVDWNVNSRISVRLFQAEYLRTQFNNGVNSNQNNFRLSAGVVFHFGKH